MKILIFFFCISFLSYLQACSQPKDKNKAGSIIWCTGALNEKSNNDIGTPVYSLNVETTSPCEIYLNDILVAKNRIGSLEIFEMINDFILKSGKQSIRLVFSEKPELTNLNLHVSSSVGDTDYKLYSDYSRENLNIIEWEVDILVPYNQIGWSKSEDLREHKQDELKKMVLDYYVQIKDAINSGDAENYLKEYANAEKELNESFYLSEKEIQEEQQQNKLRIADSKGKTKLLSMFQMKFYANGKIVCLQDEEGNSPIVSERNNVTSYFGFLLHIPKGKNRLEIIR